MTNKQVAQAFADGKTSGKSLHMFIEGDTIYSYGKHFPIAIRDSLHPRTIRFNSRGYSKTTARHKALVRQVLSPNVFIVSNEL